MLFFFLYIYLGCQTLSHSRSHISAPIGDIYKILAVFKPSLALSSSPQIAEQVTYVSQFMVLHGFGMVYSSWFYMVLVWFIVDGLTGFWYGLQWMVLQGFGMVYSR